MLEKLMKEKGLSQVELAERLNVSQQAISKWIRNEAKPRMSHIIFKLAEILEVSVETIFNCFVAK